MNREEVFPVVLWIITAVGLIGTLLPHTDWDLSVTPWYVHVLAVGVIVGTLARVAVGRTRRTRFPRHTIRRGDGG